jgi:lipopolysaccharide transport system ATP-binding protein
VGDAFFVQKCMRFLREFMKTGTILFVSHDTGAVVNLCKRAIWLHQGEMIMDGPARQVTEAYLANLAEEAYGGPLRQAPEAVGAATAALSTPDVQGRSFGKGGARIIDAVLLDESGAAIQAVIGDELVTLRIRCEVIARLESPIVGFIVKDRLGQVLFSDNTFLRYADRPLAADPGSVIEARFAFVMPTLAAGEYTIGVAIAEGTQVNHVQHHWIHDALLVTSLTSSAATGLMGIPMREVSLVVGQQP